MLIFLCGVSEEKHLHTMPVALYKARIALLPGPSVRKLGSAEPSQRRVKSCKYCHRLSSSQSCSVSFLEAVQADEM